MSLAQKAGKISSGGYAAEAAIRSGNAFLVIVARDASDNTRKKMSDMARFYDVPLYCIGTKEELGRCIGKEYRSMIAVLDEGFAQSLSGQIKAAGTTE